MATKGNNNQQNQQAQEEATARGTGQLEQGRYASTWMDFSSGDLDEVGGASFDSDAWKVIHRFDYDTKGFIIDGKPIWRTVRAAELTGFMATGAGGDNTDADLDIMPPNSVAIVRAGSQDLMYNSFETYYTMRPIDITFPTWGWYDDWTGQTSAHPGFWTTQLAYSADEQAGLTARYGNRTSGYFGAEALDYKLKSKYTSFLEGLSSSTIRNQTINPKISYNDMRIIDVTEIKGAQSAAALPETDSATSSTDMTSGAY
tara:strand:+ start:13802 stop:14575 length:774 start_codon:yes stop_codon:yes gene_type:complete